MRAGRQSLTASLWQSAFTKNKRATRPNNLRHKNMIEIMKHEVANGPYGLIRVGDVYVNSNGLFSKTGEKVSTKTAKKLLGLDEE